MTDLAPYLPMRPVREIRSDKCPWPGLVPYQESDEDRLYGRDDEITELAHRIRTFPLIVIPGPSGYGKSTLVYAGVIPRLKRSGEGWTPIIIRPGRDPMDSLISASMSLLEPRTNTTLAWDLEQTQSLKARLQQEPTFIASSLRKFAKNNSLKLVVFIDQAEEIFTLANAEKRSAFLSCIRSMAHDPSSPIRVVMAIRSDFLDRLITDAGNLMAELSLGGLFFLNIPDQLESAGIAV